MRTGNAVGLGQLFAGWRVRTPRLPRFRPNRYALASGLAVAVALIPVGYRSAESVRYRNLRVVHEGRLYRSGQMPPDAFARVVREFGIGTVVSFRDTKDETGVHDDQFEADFCAAHGVAFHRLPPADWSPDETGTVPGERTVTDFLRVLDDPATRWPVLVHCFAGIHRTGAHCAVYRIEYDGWPAADAIAEMWSMGTVRTTFADNLLGYLAAYRPARSRCRPAP